MNRKIRFLFVVFAALWTATGWFPAEASAYKHKHEEDFTTTDYRDAGATTAWWDVASGQLMLYPFVPTFVANCGGGAFPNKAVACGHLLYITNADGINIVDISDPENPAGVGSCDLLPYNTTTGIAVSRHYAFVSRASYGVDVIDILDPTNPTVVANCATLGTARRVILAGDRAFVSQYDYGVAVIDISDPTSPSVTWNCDTNGYAFGMDISGNYLYVADAAGLRVIDIKHPDSAAPVAFRPLSGYAVDVAIDGNHAYVADSSSGLRVIDITDPLAPDIVGTCFTSGSVSHVAIWGDYAFVVDDNQGLQMIDISSPEAPWLIGPSDFPFHAGGVSVSGDLVFTTSDNYGTKIFRGGYPTTPTLVGQCATAASNAEIAVAGDLAYATALTAGLQVVDFSIPSNPNIAATCGEFSDAQGIAVAGDYAFVADGLEGLRVVDISGATPGLAATCDTPGDATAVFVAGNRAFVADGYAGLQVIQILDPEAPALTGSYDTAGEAYDLDVVGDIALVADGTAGLQVIDITTPSSPVRLGTCSMSGIARGVEVSGRYAYVAADDAGLLVINITVAIAPFIAATCPTPEPARGVAISGNRAYVAAENGGLQVVDISSPEDPALLEACDLGVPALGATVPGQHALVSTGINGIRVVQVAQGEFDAANNVGQSLPVDEEDDTIIRVRISAQDTAQVDWQVSANGGADWENMIEGHYVKMANPGSDLVWRSTHSWAEPGTNPAVSHLDVHWLVEAAICDSIVDVPGDDGGWVYAHFTRSGYDFDNEDTLPIASYGIWRRLESAVLADAVQERAARVHPSVRPGDRAPLADVPTVSYEGESYVVPGSAAATASFPPGTWVLVSTVPAVQQQTYIAAVPTLADSGSAATYNMTYVMTAHTTTPSIWYAGNPESGYSKDNIAPGVPLGVSAAYTADGVALDWGDAPEADFQYYRIYRGVDPDFVPGPAALMHETAASTWWDQTPDPWAFHYKVTVVDHAGNESVPGSPESVSGAPSDLAPARTALLNAEPNPFNPTTKLVFDLAQPGHVLLEVYDVAGREVNVLVDALRPAGRHFAVWDGRDGFGQQVASGVYFYRLTTGNYGETRRMTLIK